MNVLAADIGNAFLGSGHFLTNVAMTGTLVSLFLSNSIIIAGVLLLFILSFAGVSVIGAGGDKQKMQGAMKMAGYGVAGFLLVFATFFIIRIIEAITGVDILQ